MSEYTFFLLHKLLVVGVNGLMLVSVFVAMYQASLTPDDFTFTFFKTIGVLFLLTLVVALGGKRLLNRYRPLAS
ncbi:MAG: hypothetical protein Q4G66_06915 [bacterium]|nr:hypothetical protein [bacterium]